MTSLETRLVCTPCGNPFDLREEECKVVAFFLTETGGLRLEVGCAHKAIDNIEDAFAVTASRTCMFRMLNAFADKIQETNHGG